MNATFPIVNDPFGKCFFVPAITASTRAKAVALETFDVVPDITLSLLSEGARSPGWRAARMLRGGVPTSPSPCCLTSIADSAGRREKSTRVMNLVG